MGPPDLQREEQEIFQMVGAALNRLEGLSVRKYRDHREDIQMLPCGHLRWSTDFRVWLFDICSESKHLGFLYFSSLGLPRIYDWVILIPFDRKRDQATIIAQQIQTTIKKRVAVLTRNQLEKQKQTSRNPPKQGKKARLFLDGLDLDYF